MNFRKLLYVAALILAAAGCKKDEETEVSPSLDGRLMIEGLDEFAVPGQTFELKAKGVTHPDNGKIGYYWKILPSKPDADTTDVYRFTVTDTLKTCNVYCYAFAEGYSNSSAVLSYTVIKSGPDGSIQGVDYGENPGTITLTGQSPIYYRQIGSQTWTLNNMSAGNGLAFRNAEAMADVFGRYYNFQEAHNACELLKDATGENWCLPTHEDWKILESYIDENKSDSFGNSFAAALMADASFNDTDMLEYWPAVGDVLNGTHFSALPVGFANTESGSFIGEFEYVTFWTSDSINETEAKYVYIICDQPQMQTGKGYKSSFGASVRCILK